MGVFVETQLGRVEGREEKGVQAFRGIPYARPPLGPLRFRPPQPAEPWPGVRDASCFGRSAPQNRMMLPLPGMDVGPTDEDCLYLNVYTPGADGGRRPVLVWIHGGGFVIGSGAQSIYDGSKLARRGDVVVVTLNYRLGPLGFLFLADLCPDLEGAAGNCGLRDQVAALRWVQENIAVFGGDPGNVTVFGESAGGMSVGTLLAMPSARGLFRRAVAQSGASHNFHSRETATKVAATFLETHAIAPHEAARALIEAPAKSLLATQQQTMFKLGFSLGLLPFQPLVDGEALPARPLDAVAQGAAAGVSLLTGTTRDEWKLFALLDPDVPRLDRAGLVEKLSRRIPGIDAAELVETYRAAREGSEPTDPASLFFAIETDRVFRIPAIRLAETQLEHQPRTFVYRFDWPSPAFGGVLGACHAVELPFVFGAFDAPGADAFVGSGPLVERLAARCMDAWLSFAREGDPSHPGLPEAWEAYDTQRRGTFLFGAECSLAGDPGAAERRFWEGRV